MSWNEPGGDKKDPWSGRDDQKGPPDLDEVIRSLQEKLGAIFGGGGGGKRAPSMKGFWLVVVAGAVLLWGLSGFYIVEEGNRGVETQFGKYTETSMPGLNWHIPWPVEQVSVVDVEQQRFIEVGYRSGGRQSALGSVPKEALMLTEDENIIDVRLAVQYQVKDAQEYLFNVRDPDGTLKQVIESAERGVIGKNRMDFVLTEGRSEIVAEIKSEIQRLMDDYKAGILVTTVNLQDAQPPEEVQSAFEDAIKAREDKQRLINEAQAYANEVIPKARGAAARTIQEAEGYKAKVVARADGEAARFSQLLAEYKEAPDITRKRLYLEAMESVLSRTDTVLLDIKGGNNMVYLPLDRLRSGSRGADTDEEPTTHYTPTSVPEQTQGTGLRTSSRGRDGRGR